MSALIEQSQALVCDLDGVVYAGPQAIPGAVPALEHARSNGVRIIYATNNASRPPQEVADHLSELGLTVTGRDVVNSSMAGAHLLKENLAAGSAVMAAGGPGVAQALRDEGFTPVAPSQAQEQPVVAVLQGYGKDLTAGDLAEVAYAVAGGARWIATNTDRTLPTDRGRAPGNGTLIAAVQTATGVEPQVAGKPEPVMYQMAAEALGVPAEQVLGVGDRLETDIEGARRAGCKSVLVLTGVHGYADAVTAPQSRRPDFVIDDLSQLFEPYEIAPGSKRELLHRLWEQIDAGDVSVEEAAAQMKETA